MEAATATATGMLDQDGDGKLTVDDVKIAASKAKQQVESAMAKAKELGFFSHFSDYNQEIISPFKEVQSRDLDTLKDEIIATLKLAPTSPRNGFVFFNVLALVFGILESILGYFLGAGILSLIWNGVLGYFIAYTLYWTVTCAGNAMWMRYALLFLLLYVVFNVWLAVSTLIFVIPAALYGAKAFVNLLQLLNGYALLKEMIKPDESVFSLV